MFVHRIPNGSWRLLCFPRHGRSPVPDQQFSAKPCGALPSKWGNPFSCFPDIPQEKRTKGKNEGKDKGKDSRSGGRSPSSAPSSSGGRERLSTSALPSCHGGRAHCSRDQFAVEKQDDRRGPGMLPPAALSGGFPHHRTLRFPRLALGKGVVPGLSFVISTPPASV